jgi:adenylylsulfate kinase
MKYSGLTLWFTGLSGAGKTTVSQGVELELKKRCCRVEVLDGDVVRTHLSQGLGFSKEDRDINVHRIGFVASLLSRYQVIAISRNERKGKTNDRKFCRSLCQSIFRNL